MASSAPGNQTEVLDTIPNLRTLPPDLPPPLAPDTSGAADVASGAGKTFENLSTGADHLSSHGLSTPPTTCIPSSVSGVHIGRGGAKTLLLIKMESCWSTSPSP